MLKLTLALLLTSCLTTHDTGAGGDEPSGFGEKRTCDINCADEPTIEVKVCSTNEAQSQDDLIIEYKPSCPHHLTVDCYPPADLPVPCLLP